MDGHGCWTCSELHGSRLPELHDSMTPLDAVEPSAAPAVASSLRLGVDGGSKYVLLVANWCRARSELELELHYDSTREGPEMVTPQRELKGANTITRSLASASGSALASQLLGDCAKSQAEVSQWLSWRNTTIDMSTTRLQALDVYLGPKAVLVGAGTKISLADLATFALVHDAVAALASSERLRLSNLIRWFDYIQMKGDVDNIYERIPVEKPTFSPPLPLPKAPPTENARKALPAASASAQPIAPAAVQPAAPSANGPSPSASAQTPAADGGPSDGGKKDKKEKEKKEKPQAQKKEVDSSISMLDIRVGEITKVWKHPGADTLYVEEIDIGQQGTRQVVSGLAKFLTEEEMLGRRVLVLANVKAGKVREVTSSGLVLCASNEDHSQCQPVAPPPGAAVGERVSFEGHQGQPEEVLNPKKKQFEKIQPDLRTDVNGVANFQGVPFMTSSGPCTSLITNAIIK